MSSSATSFRGPAERLSPAMRVAGVVLLLAGMLHLYADRVLFDADSFASRAALCLRDPRVASYLGERLTDEAIAQKRDLTAFRPLIAATARAIVSSDPFRAGFRRAARGGHAALFSEQAEQVALSLPDLGVLVRSALSHDPAIAEKIPASLRGDVVVAPAGRAARGLMTLARLGHRFRRNAWMAIIGGTLLLGLGIALPRDRRRALLSGGAALAVGALVLFFLPALLRSLVAWSAPSAVLRPVLTGVWDGFTDGLRVWALVLAGMGVVLAAAASSFASHFEVEQIAERFWRRITTPAPTRAGELLRGALLAIAGLYAALRPAPTLRSLTVIAGALLAFEGLRTLFVLLPPRSTAGTDPAAGFEPGPAGDAMRTWLRAGLVGALALAGLAGATAYLASPRSLPQAPVATDLCNGSAALCGRTLDAVVFPGAHNSMAAADVSTWMFPNQELGSVALLGAGIRALLFDVHYGMPVGDRVKTDLDVEANSRAKFDKAVGPEGVDAAMRIRDRMTGAPTGSRGPYLCHGFCELGAQPLVPMLEGVRDFLVENPGEVLIFVIEDYVTSADLAAAFAKSGLERYVYRGRITAPWPTLREMIDADQRLVVFGENDTTGVPWYHPAFETLQETPYTFHTPGEFSCRPNRGGTAGGLFQINHWIETTPAPRPSNAEIVNARDFLLARARTCQKERGRLPNILAVDFAMTGDVTGAAAALNDVAP